MVDTVIKPNQVRLVRLDLEGEDTLEVKGGILVGDEDESIRFTGPTDGARIVNDGTIENTAEEGRAIRFEEEVGDSLNAEIVNTGLIRSADDAIQIDSSDVASGTLRVENAAKGEIRSDIGEALDFGDVTGDFRSVVVNAGRIAAGADDSVKLGATGRVENSGTIFGGSAKGYVDGADGVSFEDDATGVVINTGRILGDRHAVDAGEGTTIRVMNREGGEHTGRNGSGVGSDGSATVVNFGVITGSFSDSEGSDVHGSTPGEEDGGEPDGVNDGDGDGVDVDFEARIENHGVIQGLGAGGTGSDGLPNTSEGIAAGGGVILNFEGAEITGLGLGVLIDDSSQGNAPFLTRIENAGEISGGSSFAIRIVSALDDVVVNSGVIAGGDGVAIQFGSGNNRLAIGDGSQMVGVSQGGDGVDTLDYRAHSTGATVDLRSGSATGTDGVEDFENVRGSSRDDIVSGDKGDNLIEGGRGADTLLGGAGADTLVGGRGDDVFQFTAKLGGNFDAVDDFAPGHDRIELSGAVFGLETGKLADAAFALAGDEQGATRIVYDKANGALLYDADGAGGADAVKFAELDPGLDLSRGDFFVI